MEEAYKAAELGDYPTALAIWGPLAHAGVARAQNNIGACFAEGLGVEMDKPLAAKWLALSASASDPVGQRNLASLYFKGEGVEQDDVRAAELYRGAAQAGDGPSQDMLSWILLESDVIESDHAEALRWALAAAKQGIASSMTRVGMIYHNALGALAGDADGQAMLGAAYHLGSGVPTDRLTAFVWLLRARAGRSNLAARFFATVEAALSEEEIAEAEYRAAQPLPQSSP
jgi:TPR repeat protein